MPAASRKETQSQRLQDKEAKRARGTLSCAECRRLKLKCDKTVPCSSCKRRGCAAICPNGSLVTGQGTRFVLADTEKLHYKISQMSDRIRHLEDALTIAHSALNGPNCEPHPLLDRDLLKIKSSIELHSASTIGSVIPEEGLEAEAEEEEDEEKYIDAFGTLAIRDGGAATFYGRSAGQESLLIGESSARTSVEEERSPIQPYVISATSSFSDIGSEAGPSSRAYYAQGQHDDLAPEAPLPESIAHISQRFPLAPSIPSSPSSTLNPYAPVTLSTLITVFLPHADEAERLIQLYLQQAPWFFGAVTERQIEQEIMPMWYKDAASSGGSTSPVTPGKPRSRTSHDLALLFMLFCFGSLTDVDLPPPPDNQLSDKFYQLAKCALILDPNAAPDGRSTKNGIMDRPPSVATVQTLSLMAIYEGLCSGENSIETTWLLFGLATKLSQSIGLHRDSARWKLPPAEVQKRRALFWELFITDCWQSLATGRLAAFSLPFVDCELPFDPEQTIANDGTTQPSFPFWKARFGAECVSAVVQGSLTSRAPKYSIILDLDRKVRDMELPLYASGDPPQGKGLRQTMSHFMPQNYRELTLLYIHRCFFAHAISSNPIDPVKSQYAPSFLAGFRSACAIVKAVKLQFTMFSAQISRFWVLWTHAFSASIMLSSIAIHAPRSKMAPAALLQLKIACDLFEDASKYGGRATKFLPILRRLQRKAQQAYRDVNNGIPSDIPNDIFKPSQPDQQKDELSIFSGKTHTVSTISTSISTPTSISLASSQDSNSPSLIYTDNPSFSGVHPSLISELNSFQPFIRESVRNAYRIGEDVFGGEPMVVDPIRWIPVGRGSASQPQQLQMQQHIEQEQQQQEKLEQQRRQLENERLERERLELTRQEMARQEIERQEIARQHAEQQELHRQQELRLRELQRQQQAQEEAILRQEQEASRRQQERAEQLQRRQQYRQQLEIQQRQIEQEKMQMQVSNDSNPSTTTTTTKTTTLSTTRTRQIVPPPVRQQLSHSRSSSSLGQMYQQTQRQITADISPPFPVQLGRTIQREAAQPYFHQPSILQTQIMPQPQPQHAIPRYEFSAPDTVTMKSDAVYSFGQSSPVGPPGPSGQMSLIADTYNYWPAARTSFGMPVEHQSLSDIRPMPDFTPLLPVQPCDRHHYTPEGALRGIAADDMSLQETWQSYMSKVGSPRQFLED